MRHATLEEINSVNEHIESISTDTGVAFYDTVDDYIKDSIKELRELREYKNKVEKFISKYDGLVMKAPVKTVIDNLKEALCYENQL